MQNTDEPTPTRESPRRMLGGFIRVRRQMANLSLRQLSVLTEVSNPYLSQVERGMHEPSVRVFKSIGEALNVSAETLFEQAGLTSPAENLDDEATENTIRADPRLSQEQRHALLGVYRSYVGANTEDTSWALPPIEPSRARSVAWRRRHVVATAA